MVEQFPKSVKHGLYSLLLPIVHHAAYFVQKEEKYSQIQFFKTYSLLDYCLTLCMIVLLICIIHMSLIRHNDLISREFKICTMITGLLGLLTCLSFQYVSCWCSYYNFKDGTQYVFFSHILAFAMFTFLLKFTYMCKFTQKNNSFQYFLLLAGALAGSGQAIRTANIVEIYHGVYFYIIGMLVIDCFALLCEPTKVFFLRDLIGKYVICQIGPKVRQGYLKSVLRGDELNLELIYSQRIFNGKTRKRLMIIRLYNVDSVKER
ncbi:hypothetical protein CRE_00820 [Caenorhabditis remanei]|uniref:Uncharacterized protein n=1 Tax=Caenorhabditis remanei TaxID=31234 RepID=E3LEH8_CAERE|nr:hypothetical protein CRE_00820 [Caenorhabditis remanei]